MQMAREIQQNAPTFFTGFLKIDRNPSCKKNKRYTIICIFKRARLQKKKKEGEEREYLSCRYELYSRIVGIAISHHKINLYTITGFRGGIQRQNLRKKVLSSTVKNAMQRLRT